MATEPTMIEYPNGIKVWWVDGKRHRLDGPAVEWTDGTKEWWVDGERHRLDGPAVEWTDGTKEWWLNSMLHRPDGPAVESSNGLKEWYLNGRHHRPDGPAIEHPNGAKEWCYGGTRYEPGPAIEFLTYDPVSGYGLLFDGTYYRVGCKRAATVEEARLEFEQDGADDPSCAWMFLDAVVKHVAKF